jgi:hypothetical protein
VFRTLASSYPVNRTIKEFPYAVKEKLFKGEIPSEKLILLDKDNAQICDDDDEDERSEEGR